MPSSKWTCAPAPFRPPVEADLTQQRRAVGAVDALQHMDLARTAASEMMVADDPAPPLDHADPLVQFAGTAQLAGDQVAPADAADLEGGGENRFDPFQPVRMGNGVVVGDRHHLAA